MFQRASRPVIDSRTNVVGAQVGRHLSAVHNRASTRLSSRGVCLRLGHMRLHAGGVRAGLAHAGRVSRGNCTSHNQTGDTHDLRKLKGACRIVANRRVDGLSSSTSQRASAERGLPRLSPSRFRALERWGQTSGGDSTVNGLARH